MKNKIEELKKGCHKIVYESPNQQIRCGVRQGVCLSCEEKLQAYEEAQKIMDETLKNIIDEIEKLGETRNNDNSLSTITGENFKTNSVKYLKEHLKQIIQKHFNIHRDGRPKGKDEFEESSATDKVPSVKNMGTSILDDFCKELKNKLHYNVVEKESFISFSETAFKRDIGDVIDKLKKKHGGKQ